MIEATSEKVHAQEGGHWYKADGSPCYEVPYADPSKGMRPTSLRDARKMNLFPGVTSIISTAARPGLEQWKSEQLLLAALTLPRREMENEKEWIARVYEDSKAQAAAARDKGTLIHAELKRAFSGENFGETAETVMAVQSVVAALNQHFPGTKWVPEVAFASPMGYGGSIDLSGDCESRNEDITVDFKTTEFDPPGPGEKQKPMTYDEHVMQGTAYSNGRDSVRPTKRVANIYISTSTPGLVYLYEWTDEEKERGWTMFQALLAYWQASKGYRPYSFSQGNVNG